MSVEVEQKHSGGGGILGKAGEKRNTGWYIVHDSADDPIVGTFNGQRFYRQYPNKTEMVAAQYQKSDLAKTFLPDILREWENLRTTVGPVEFDPRGWWYRILNFAPPHSAIDVINNPAAIKSDAQLHLISSANVSGQFWQFRPSKTIPGHWNLCTLFLGQNMCLDVYGDDKRRPHLAPAGAYTGQQWLVTSRGDGTWSLTNSYSGPDLLLEGKFGNADGPGALSLNERQDTRLEQKWVLAGIRLITEDGFLGR